ncbi:MAG: competence/damage-inducible protein A [Flavobacteriaceae bacterium]|jgi:nicotinamide-nucleotide amidase|nr:competence/damage-inducible protein A [Flavobacteriaceae bacterium]
MTAELITIGDEILIGQIVNTNAVFLSKSLNGIGFEVVQITSISDQPEVIKKTIDEARLRADVLLLTGGLGPTNDDVTKHTLTDYFNDRLVWYPEILSHIETLFKKYVPTPISDSNRAQAQLPEKARIFKNTIGTASGMWFEAEDVVVVSMPGVPYEMKSLMNNEVLPALQEKFDTPHIYHKTIMTYGLGESVIADRIADWEAQLPSSIKLAYLPSLGRVRLRLSTKGIDAALLHSQVDAEVAKLRPLIEDVYYGEEEEEPIEVLIGKQLQKQGQTLAIAESCTGGLIASRMTTHPGASAFFLGGGVTYATSSKTHLLGVSETIIAKHGVVSAAVAEAMAKGAQQTLGSDYALATTGNAGPTALEGHADVGTVFIGLATPDGVESFRFVMGNNRERVMQKTVNKAFELLFKALHLR